MEAHHLVSQQAAEFIEKAAPVATKAALGSGITTVGATSLWSLPDIAAFVGIICTILTASSAIVFQYLNYRLKREMVRNRMDEV